MSGNRDIIIKKFVNILSLNESEERSILPPKGKKLVRIHINIMREVKVGTSQLDKIVGMLMRSRKIKFIGKDFPND